MSESEDENFCFFGKPLDPYDEDAFPKKKPIALEEQIATDTEGRRRFHGAFTGGFSAGFFNTVGSLEGWTPSEFKSTRQDKAKNVKQKPEDFMDDEDFGEYGIAHQTVKATKEYSTIKKRKRQMFPDGPIPGEPVLQTLLSSGNETVGYLLLKNIGIQDKISNQKEELDACEGKVYGCQMPTEYKIPKSIENKQYRIPQIYEIFLTNPKSNSFGLGYKGLDKIDTDLFQSTSLVMKDKNNKKISIRGQAFGVGAFEEEDDDIYTKEDMSKYDFELSKEKSNKKESEKANLLFGMFKKSKFPLLVNKMYPPPNIPHSFTGKHKVRKSRFEPIIEQPSTSITRKEINPAIRAAYLGENVEKANTDPKSTLEPARERVCETATNQEEQNRPKGNFDLSSVLISDRFVSASQKEDVNSILEPVQRTESTHGTKELRDAARMKMFGPLTRVTIDWHPCSILCKRFNVPEPFMDRPDERNKKRTKNLIFEYQKHADVDILSPGLSTKLKQEETEIVESNVTSQDSTNITTEDLQGEKQESEIITLDPQDSSGAKLDNSVSVKDITEKVDVTQNLDLFKAIFLSSSESENEDDTAAEEKSDPNKIEELKANILSDSLIPKIKPNKEGILSNVNFHTFSKPKRALEETGEQMKPENSTLLETFEIKEEAKVTSYGPALPSKKVEIAKVIKVTVVPSDSEDEWVEKNEESKKRHKKKRKKEKHKKHKHDKKKSRTEK